MNPPFSQAPSQAPPQESQKRTPRKKTQILYADHLLEEKKVPLKDKLRRGLLASAGALLLIQTSLCLGIPQHILERESLQPQPPTLEETLPTLAQEDLKAFANKKYQIWRDAHPEEAKILDQKLREEILEDLLPLWGESQKIQAEQYATWLAGERQDKVNPLELDGFQEAYKKAGEQETLLCQKIVQTALNLDHPSPKEQALYPKEELPKLAQALRALLRLHKNPQIADPATQTALKEKIHNLFHKAQLPTLVQVAQTPQTQTPHPQTQLSTELESLEKKLSEKQAAQKQTPQETTKKTPKETAKETLELLARGI
jgi:hypothetical protein